MCLNKWVQTKVYEPILPHPRPNCNKYFKKYFKKLSPSVTPALLYVIPAQAGIHPSSLLPLERGGLRWG